MKAGLCSSSAVALAGTFAVLLMTVASATPVQDVEEEQADNMLVSRGETDELSAGWDAVDAAALRKLLMQLDDDRLTIGGRVGRSWPQAEPRGLSLRQLPPLDGRLARQWRADKRQVRFRQCYFNPISCFRK